MSEENKTPNAQEDVTQYAEHEMAVELDDETQENVSVQPESNTAIKSYDWMKDPATRIALVTGLASVIVTLLNVLTR